MSASGTVVALLLHGRLGSWFASGTELPGAQRAGGKPAMLSSVAALRAFAAFTHDSFDRHIVQPAARAGTPLRIVLHSWSPEVGETLDALYRPAASAHEPPRADLDKVASQHLSMHRAYEMLSALRGSPPALVMVARLDLLLFTDVPLAALATTTTTAGGTAVLARAGDGAASADAAHGGVLYLPHTCVPSRLRLPAELAASESHVLKRTCSGAAAYAARAHLATGRRVLPTQLTRYQPYMMAARSSTPLGCDTRHHTAVIPLPSVCRSGPARAEERWRMCRWKTTSPFSCSITSSSARSPSPSRLPSSIWPRWRGASRPGSTATASRSGRTSTGPSMLSTSSSRRAFRYDSRCSTRFASAEPRTMSKPRTLSGCTASVRPACGLCAACAQSVVSSRVSRSCLPTVDRVLPLPALRRWTSPLAASGATAPIASSEQRLPTLVTARRSPT